MELDVLELLAVFCLLDDKHVHTLKPYPWRVGDSTDGPDFKFLYQQVAGNEGNGTPHSCSMYPFKILTLEEEICV